MCIDLHIHVTEDFCGFALKVDLRTTTEQINDLLRVLINKANRDS